MELLGLIYRFFLSLFCQIDDLLVILHETTKPSDNLLGHLIASSPEIEEAKLLF